METSEYLLNIEEISVDDVIIQDTKRYNSNNHWVDSHPPEDYRQVCCHACCISYLYKYLYSTDPYMHV